jgi:pyrroloquinoline quinone (PQQ) biosynthesis protein C
MEREDLIEQGQKKYTQFVNWSYKYVCGDAGLVLGEAVMYEYEKIINALADETNESLVQAVKEVKEWMDFLRNKSKSFQTKQEFREWVLQNKDSLLNSGKTITDL